MSGSSQTPVRAVVFDLDGLMFNTEDIFNDIGHEVLRRRGKVLTPEVLQEMMGRRAPEAIACMIRMCELSDTVEELVAETRTLFWDWAEHRLQPMPGLFELLAAIERAALPKAVATSSHRNYLERILGRFDLLERFHFTLAAEDVTHGKPHPEIYETAASRLGLTPPEMLVLEDSHAGTTAAVRSRALTVSIPTVHSRYQDFAHATFVAERLDDPRILALLRS